MNDDLTTNLETALEREHSGRSPDLAWVLARGRRLRLLRFASVALSVVVVAGVITTALVALPTDGRSPNPVTGDDSPAPQESPSPQSARKGEIVEEVTARQRAEVFAFRALAATGLMDPFGKRSYNFTYEDDTTATSEGGWRIGFAASDCEPRGGVHTCRGLSGEHPETGNALADTFVVVEPNEGVWRVVDVEGNILDEERDRVVGYDLPDRDEPSHWEFPVVSLRSPDEGFSVTMLPLWVGPYPTESPGSVCTIEARDGQGEMVGERVIFYEEPPNREFERAGWVMSRGVPGANGAEAVDVGCRQYTGLGWEVPSDPEIVGSPGEVSGVTAKLVWRGDEGFTTAAICRATLQDEDGEVMWEGSGRVEPLWRQSELKGYPYRTVVFITTRGESVDAEEIGEFSCRSL
jgi:hypothetical protein